MDSRDRCDKACEILRKTNDGNDLDAYHLKLIEMAVNGFLNDEGEKAFNGLHTQVMTEGYKKPWFHGIENLIIDQTGYVYWKEKEIEHYDIPWAYSDEAKEESIELARRCRIIEERGDVPNTSNVIWRWDDDEEATSRKNEGTQGTCA